MAKRTTIKSKKVLDQHHKPEINQITDAKGNTLQITAQFPYEVRENESGSWIAYSPHFRTIGYSNKSEADAIEDFRIAINTFFEIHIKLGTIEKALMSFSWFKESNIIKTPKLFNTPIRKGTKRRTFSLNVQNERVGATV